MVEAQYQPFEKDDELLPLEGKSLMPVLNKENNMLERTLYWEFKGSRAVRKGPWKLVAERDRGWELYNILKDRSELNNLGDKYPHRVTELEKLYKKWSQRIGATSNSEAKEMRLNRRAKYTFDRELK